MTHPVLKVVHVPLLFKFCIYILPKSKFRINVCYVDDFVPNPQHPGFAELENVQKWKFKVECVRCITNRRKRMNTFVQKQL